MSPEADRDFERRAAQRYRANVPMGPLDGVRLARAIRAADPPRRGSWLQRLQGSRSLSLSPLGAATLALALLAAGAALRAGWRSPAGSPAPPPAVSSAHARVVEFVFVAPRAYDVVVVGDFNGWDRRATPMRRVQSGRAWTAVVAIPEGRYNYAFVVNGTRWLADPAAPMAPDDGYGLRSSVLVVQGSRSS